MFPGPSGIGEHSRALEVEFQPQLSYACVDSGAGYDAESWRRKIRIRIGELRMVEGIEELGTKLKTAAIVGPAKGQQF